MKTETYYENGLTVVKTVTEDYTEWEYFDQNWKLHREDGPAYINTIGTQCWWKHGKLHRDYGPAIIDSNGMKLWYQNASLHNEYGPAVIYPSGTKEYWINGKKVNPDQLQNKENAMFVIINDFHEYWSNEFGWTPNINDSTLFNDEIHNLPINGKILKLNTREIYEHPQFYPIKDSIDRAFNAFMLELKMNNVPAVNDDRAEKLINHMTEYVISSGNIKL